MVCSDIASSLEVDVFTKEKRIRAEHLYHKLNKCLPSAMS